MTLLFYIVSRGERSKKALKILKDRGYKNLYQIKNGLDGI